MYLRWATLNWQKKKVIWIKQCSRGNQWNLEMTSTHEFQSVEVHYICALQDSILTTLIWTAMFLSIKSREMISTVTSTPMISQTPCYFFPLLLLCLPTFFFESVFFNVPFPRVLPMFTQLLIIPHPPYSTHLKVFALSWMHHSLCLDTFARNVPHLLKV